MRKSKVNREEVIEYYKNGLKYKEIALKLNSTESTIKHIIKRYAPKLQGNPLDKQEVIKLFASGFSYKQIADKFNSNPDAIRMIIIRNAPEELEKNRQTRKLKSKQLFDPQDEEIHLEITGALSVSDRKEMMNEKTWGLDQNGGMSDYSFFQWNRQSFISDRKDNRKYRFDKRRGKIQRDLCTLNL